MGKGASLCKVGLHGGEIKRYRSPGAGGVAGKVVKVVKEGVEAEKVAKILAEEVTGKTRSELRELAKEKGLVPKGDPSHPDYPRKWDDPTTGKPVLRLDRGHVDAQTGRPFDKPNAAADHAHANDEQGNPITTDGDRHIPTTGD